MTGKSPKRNNIERVVSTVDIYPTLMALCGVEMNFQTDGNNMVPLLHDKQTTRWKDAAWSYFNRGITVRTESYRLTKYSRSAAPVIELFEDRKSTHLNSSH